VVLVLSSLLVFVYVKLQRRKSLEE
jgi:hypothetical protein